MATKKYQNLSIGIRAINTTYLKRRKKQWLLDYLVSFDWLVHENMLVKASKSQKQFSFSSHLQKINECFLLLISWKQGKWEGFDKSAFEIYPPLPNAPRLQRFSFKMYRWVKWQFMCFKKNISHSLRVWESFSNYKSLSNTRIRQTPTTVSWALRRNYYSF